MGNLSEYLATTFYFILLAAPLLIHCFRCCYHRDEMHES